MVLKSLYFCFRQILWDILALLILSTQTPLARILLLLYFPHAQKLDQECITSLIQEDSYLTKIVTEVGLNDWTAVATRLKQRYDQFDRTGKQCR